MIKTSIFKSRYNTKSKTINPKIILKNKLKLTIKDNKIIFTKLINTSGYQLSKKNGDYYFDFNDDPKKLKNIKIVVFNIDENKELTINIYKDISIYSYNAQREESVEIDSDDIQYELLTTEMTATNINKDTDDSITISSARYRFLFTNDDKNILYYFATNNKIKFPLILLQLKKIFGVNSIDFFIDEKKSNSSSRSRSRSGGEGGIKKQMKKYN